MPPKKYRIVTFYKFVSLADPRANRDALDAAMRRLGIRGTIILGDEGFNSTLCGEPGDVEQFLAEASEILGTPITGRSSHHDEMPFRRVHVRVKPEIVTLKQKVELELGEGTKVAPDEWNRIIRDPEVYVLDTRNAYEVECGTFEGAVDPETRKFSDLPDFVRENLDPARHRRIAMFCTGGIRCEKFAPFMKGLGFDEVYQLEGGILRYLEEVPAEESLWRGECFVFDGRISVAANGDGGGR